MYKNTGDLFEKLYNLITITRLLPHCPIKLRQCESDYYYWFAHPQHMSGILIEHNIVIG